MSKWVPVLVPDVDNGEALSYSERQAYVNSNGFDLAFCQHLNAIEDRRHNYAMGITSRSAMGDSEASRSFAANYAAIVDAAMEQAGIQRTGPPRNWEDRPEAAQIEQLNVPSILAEPLFVSRLEAAVWVLSQQGRNVLARCAFQAVREALPNGGRVAILPGHIGRSDKPSDIGAPVRVPTVVGEAIQWQTRATEAELNWDICVRLKNLMLGFACP